MTVGRAMLACLNLLLAACSPTVTGPPPAIEASIQKTLKQLEDQDLRHELEDAWMAARSADTRLRGAAWRAREPTGLEPWTEAVCTAHRLLREQVRRNQVTTATWHAARDRAEQLRTRVKALGSDLTQAHFIASQRAADVAWARAERLAHRGDLVAATAAANQATAAADTAILTWQETHARFRQSTLQRQWVRWSQMAILDSRREGTALVIDKLRHRLDL